MTTILHPSRHPEYGHHRHAAKQTPECTITLAFCTPTQLQLYQCDFGPTRQSYCSTNYSFSVHVTGTFWYIKHMANGTSRKHYNSTFPELLQLPKLSSRYTSRRGKIFRESIKKYSHVFFFGTFAKLHKATTGSVTYVRPPTLNSHWTDFD